MSNKKSIKSISITGKRNIDSFSNKAAVRNIKYKQREISISEIHDIFLYIKNHDKHDKHDKHDNHDKHKKEDTSQQFSNKQKYIYQTLYTKSYSYFNQDKRKQDN